MSETQGPLLDRKGTVFWGAQLTDEKVVAVLTRVAEGCGVRKTGRLVHVHRVAVHGLGTGLGRN